MPGRWLKVKKGFLEWLGKPESWLSIAAAAISLITFYLVYAKPGNLTVFFADEVGLRLQDDSGLFVVLPVTLTNSGATTRTRVVEGINGSITKQGAAPEVPPYLVRWVVEFAFVGKEQYFQKYPKTSDEVDPRIADFLDYNGRAVPFSIQGGSSISKVLGLIQEEGTFTEPMREFTFNLRVRTAGEAIEFEARFDCEGIAIEPQITHYCRRKL